MSYKQAIALIKKLFLSVLFCLPNFIYSDDSCSIGIIPSQSSVFTFPINEVMVPIEVNGKCKFNYGTETLTISPATPLPADVFLYVYGSTSDTSIAGVIYGLPTSSGSFPVTIELKTQQLNSKFTKSITLNITNPSTTPDPVVSPTVTEEASQLTARSKKSRKCVNIIKWQPAPSGNLAMSYKIFRDSELQQLVATILDDASSAYTFTDTDCKKCKRQKYYIVAVGVDNSFSEVRVARKKIKHCY